MSNRVVVVTEDVLKHGTETFYAGDEVTGLAPGSEDIHEVRTASLADVNQWVEFGWAEDAETGDTGERIPGARGVAVNPDAVTTSGQ